MPIPKFITTISQVLLVFGPLATAEGQTPTPQKFRTFYSLDAPQVPAGLQRPSPSPLPGVSAMAKATDGAMWVGSNRGVVRFDPAAPPPDRMQFFASLRYLPDDEVVSLQPDNNGGMWIRTRTGVSHIELRPMTLMQKPGHYEARLRLRHDRYGMVADSHLSKPGDLSTNVNVSSDNDGLWTAM